MAKLFRVKREDYAALIGVVTGLIGLFGMHLLMGTLTVILGIISKQTKSIYWRRIIFAGILDFTVFIIKTYWI